MTYPVRMRLGRPLFVAALVLASVLGAVGAGRAETGDLQILIGGALSAPTGMSSDTQITVRVGVNRPVFVVSGGAVVPGTIATATFAQWTDTMPSTGFGTTSTLMVFRLAGGVMVIAAGVATPGGFLTTFSATAPVQTLSGTWSMTNGAGVAGGSASDALVTFTYDTNPVIAHSGAVAFVGDNLLTMLATKVIAGVAAVDILRNIPVLAVVGNVQGVQIGRLMGHSVYNIVGGSSEFVELRAIDLGGGTYLIYGCAFPTPTSSIACRVGGSGAVSHLSGTMDQTAGQFSSIVGVTPSDQVLRLTGALP